MPEHVAVIPPERREYPRGGRASGAPARLGLPPAGDGRARPGAAGVSDRGNSACVGGEGKNHRRQQREWGFLLSIRVFFSCFST